MARTASTSTRPSRAATAACSSPTRQTLYERCFALHDQGHLPLRRGVEVGQRPFLGLNLRMNELSGGRAQRAAQQARLDPVDTAQPTRRRCAPPSRRRPASTFRRLADPDGDIATHLVVTLPDAEIAAGRRRRPRHQDARQLGLARLHQHGAPAQPAHRVGLRQLRRRLCCRAWLASRDRCACWPARSRSASASSTPGIGSAFGINVRSDLDRHREGRRSVPHGCRTSCRLTRFGQPSEPTAGDARRRRRSGRRSRSPPSAAPSAAIRRSVRRRSCASARSPTTSSTCPTWPPAAWCCSRAPRSG